MTSTTKPNVVIVIPTRNRADLAIRALRSIARQLPPLEVGVLVSDNSTDTRERDELSEFCRQSSMPRLRYVTPPAPLSMPRHWDWAMQQSLQMGDVSHVTYLTDRMIYKDGALAMILEIASKFPDHVVTFGHDLVIDYQHPLQLAQHPGTDRFFSLDSAHLLHLTSQLVLEQSLPRMLNCLAPASVIGAIRKRFGTVFDSTAPDFSFCFRSLDTVESIVFYDRSLLVQYALERSNGWTVLRGTGAGDHQDFMANLGDIQLNYATPIPGLKTVNNAIVQEYCVAKKETGSSKFPELDKAKYLESLWSELKQIEVPEVRQEIAAVLQAHGHPFNNGGHAGDSNNRGAAPSLARKVIDKIKWESRSASAKTLWMLLGRWFNVAPPPNHRFTFDTLEEAFAFASRFPLRKPLKDADEGGQLLPHRIMAGR